MSTFKTVLLTTAVLFVSAILIAGGVIIWTQQQELNDLHASVFRLTAKLDIAEHQIILGHNQIQDTIKTANKNFQTMTTREDGFEAVIKIIVEALSDSGGPDTSNPTSLKHNPNTTGL